jgi:hypothetical protein
VPGTTAIEYGRDQVRDRAELSVPHDGSGAFTNESCPFGIGTASLPYLQWGCQFVGLEPAGFHAIRLPEGEPEPFRLVAADLWRQYHDAFGPGRRDVKASVDTATVHKGQRGTGVETGSVTNCRSLLPSQECQA